MECREGALLIAMVKEGWFLPARGVLLRGMDLESPSVIAVQRREKHSNFSCIRNIPLLGAVDIDRQDCYFLQTETRRTLRQPETNMFESPAMGSMNCVLQKGCGRFLLAQLLVSRRVKGMDTLSSVLRQAWFIALGICPATW